MVSVRVDFGKRDVLWVSVFIVLVGAGLAFAFGGGDPEVMGHSAGEILPPEGCLENESLVWGGDAWGCKASGSEYRIALCGTGVTDKPYVESCVHQCPENYSYVQHVGATDYDGDGNRYVVLCERE